MEREIQPEEEAQDNEYKQYYHDNQVVQRRDIFCQRRLLGDSSESGSLTE